MLIYQFSIAFDWWQQIQQGHLQKSDNYVTMQYEEEFGEDKTVPQEEECPMCFNVYNRFVILIRFVYLVSRQSQNIFWRINEWKHR